MTQRNKRSSLFRDIEPKVKPVQGIGGLLSKALRQIMFQRSGKNYNAVLKRIDEFVMDARKGIVSRSVASYLNRGNLRRELWQPKMTWKNFFKGLHVMRVASVEIHIHVKFDDPPLNEHGEIDHVKLEEMERPVIIKANLKGEEFFAELDEDDERSKQAWSQFNTRPRNVAGETDDQFVQDIPSADE